MNSQALTFDQQTRIAVQIVIEDDSGLLAWSLLGTTRLLWLIEKSICTVRYGLSAWQQDLKTAMSFNYKILTIALKSLIFGLGIAL